VLSNFHISNGEAFCEFKARSNIKIRTKRVRICLRKPANLDTVANVI